MVEPGEIVGVGREQRQAFSDSDRGDHEVSDPAPWFASDSDHNIGVEQPPG
jgi:hypothetical protein